MSKTSSLFLVFLVSFNLFTQTFSAEASNKKELISLLSVKTDYAIDDVLDLIRGLLETSQSELTTLQEEWPGIQAEKQGAVDLYTGLVSSQTDTCNELTAENEELADDIADTENQIAEDTDRIATNNERVENLLNDRCTQNRNYITGLKQNKQALAIIQILRDAVNNFNPSLLEKKHLRVVAKRFINFLQFASKQHITGLSQILQDINAVPDVQERTSEEIGTGHIDNTQDEITVADFDSQTIEDLQSVKTKLVNLLDELEANLETEIATNEANEANANEQLSDFEVNVENENNFLTTEIAELNTELENLRNEKQASDEAVADCEAYLESLQNSLEDAQEDLEAATNNYNENNDRLQDEVALFQEVYDLYESEVASASEALKEEVDDELDETVDDTIVVDAQKKEQTQKVTIRKKH